MTRSYLTHARVVLPDQVLNDSAVLIDDGVIAAIDPVGVRDADTVDLAGQTLLPGLIDLHCDAIEKEVEPRSRVLFPLDFAVAQIDRRNAAAGITTPFHAMSFANNEYGVRSNDMAAELVRAIRSLDHRGLVDNRVHCRYEVTDPTAAGILHGLIEEGMVDLLSVMDHSPGQGQFKTLEAYISYAMGNHGTDRHAAEAAARAKLAAREGATTRISTLLTHARQFCIPTASHDDDSEERVTMMHELGVQMSEFPMNPEAAAAAIAQKLPTILGAPNVLRGKSQGGGMRAIDAIRSGLATILCSDYQPSTLIAAAFFAADHTDIGLPAAAALVTANPARASGLTDRGRIAVGLRADLIAVTAPEPASTGAAAGRTGHAWPVVTSTWSEGRRVFAASYKTKASGYRQPVMTGNYLSEG